jgi:hypothetical protein
VKGVNAARQAAAVMLALGLTACRAHTQDLALDQATHDFTTNDASACVKSRPHVSDLSVGTTVAAPAAPAADPRSQLTPWIVGPNQYLIEGCGLQARYTCDSEACRIDGAVGPLTPYVAPAAVASAPTASTGAEPSPLVPAAAVTAPPGGSSDDEAVRATVDAKRAEIAGCVERLPLAMKIEYGDDRVAITLRGDLAGKPEEACVRAVLKDLKVKGKGTVIHVVK